MLAVCHPAGMIQKRLERREAVDIVELGNSTIAMIAELDAKGESQPRHAVGRPNRPD